MDLPGTAVRILIELAIAGLLTALALRYLPRIALASVDRAMAHADVIAGPANDRAQEQKRRQTLASLAGNLTRAGILLVAFTVVLAIFSIDLGPAMAGLGLAGLAAGLGAQSLVKDVLAGTFILLENQYSRGDVVRIANVTGTVEDVGLRRTLLRDSDGTVHSVPNGLVGVSSNETRVWSRATVEIPIKEPGMLQSAIAVAEEAGRTMAADPAWQGRLHEAPTVDRVTGATAAGVVLRLAVRVTPHDRGETGSELRRRVVEAFTAEGIALGG